MFQKLNSYEILLIKLEFVLDQRELKVNSFINIIKSY
jgi:hypothetical protein